MGKKSSNALWSDDDTKINSSKSTLRRMKTLKAQSMRQKLKSLPKSPLRNKKKAPLGKKKKKKKKEKKKKKSNTGE